jgi:hypothetical protein
VSSVVCNAGLGNFRIGSTVGNRKSTAPLHGASAALPYDGENPAFVLASTLIHMAWNAAFGSSEPVAILFHQDIA